MVSGRNILFGALVAGILGFIFLKKGTASNLITQSEIITPTTEGMFFVKPDPVPIPENPQINILKEAIAGVQNFIKTTFKAPILTKGLTTGGKTFPCRGPNCLGIFQAKGTITSFDPFTGQRVAIGQTSRGSAKALSFLGTAASLTSSLTRITAGGDLMAQAQGIIKDLQGQLSILETKTV